MPTSSLKVPTSVPLRRRFLEWITWLVGSGKQTLWNLMHRQQTRKLIKVLHAVMTPWLQLTESFRILSNMTSGGTWKSNTKYWEKKTLWQRLSSYPSKQKWRQTEHVVMTDLIIIRAVCGFFHRGVFLFFSDLHTDHWIHVQSDQLPCFNHSHADLKGKEKVAATDWLYDVCLTL